MRSNLALHRTLRQRRCACWFRAGEGSRSALQYTGARRRALASRRNSPRTSRRSWPCLTCCYTDPQALWPVAVRLYLPQAWAEDFERRGNARVPDEVTFQTKPEIAVALLDQARAWGVPHRCVVADAGYGDNPAFLAALEARQERYVMGVCADFRVTSQRKATSPVQRVDQLLQALPRWQWRTIRWRQGSQGWL